MTLLNVEQLTVLRGKRAVVDDVSFEIKEGELVGLIGPNGAGKTTLMRAALGLQPRKGTSSLSSLTTDKRAKHVAWLPQQREIAWPVTVETVVSLGRIPHLPRGKRLSPQDQHHVDQAISRMHLQSFRDRSATELSGGEQARCLIARALAQDCPLLMVDEPIAGLDPSAQIATLRVFRDTASEGKAVFASLHDLSLAARYCNRLILLSAGKIVADGPPREVLTPENLAQVFHINATVIETEHGPLFHILDIMDR